MGITTAMVSMNAVVSHCPVRAHDAQIDHQSRQRDTHDRLVQDHDEGSNEQGADDGAVARTHLGPRRRAAIGGGRHSPPSLHLVLGGGLNLETGGHKT